MGLFDNLNLDDPKTQGLLQMAFGLMAPSAQKTNFMGQLAKGGEAGLLGYSTAKKDQLAQETAERANRANDLQQLSGAYNLLKQQEFAKMLAANASGQPYTPNPMLPQMETKLGELTSLPNRSGRQPPTIPAVTPPPTLPPALPQAPQAPPPGPQMSTPDNPQFNVPPPQQPPQAPQSQVAPNGLGGPAGGIPMQAWLAMDASGKSYMDQLAKDNMEANKPVTNRGYGIGVMKGGKYVPDQASLDQALQMERGKESISQPYNVQTVRNASGADVPVFKYQLPGYPGAQSGAAGSPPQLPPAFQPKAPGVASLEVTQPSKNDPWATVPQRYKPQGTGQTTFDKSMDERSAESAAKLSEKLGSDADAANNRIALNNQALSLVDKADTGPMAAQIGDVKNWLVSRFGIPESSFANTPSATIALQKDLVNAATQRAKQQFGSRITQSEVMLMMTRGSPNVDMTKAAMKYLLDSDNKMSGYSIQKANDLGTYLQKGGDPMRYEGWHAKTFPAAAALSQAQLNTGGQPTIQEIQAEIMRRQGGSNPTVGR